MKKLSLYMGGGGARGAYQAGALKAIAEILKVKTLPFSMLTGVSIGSMNSAVLAHHADDFQTAVERLVEMWSNIHCQDVFNTSNYQLSKSVFRNLKTIMFSDGHAGYFLDSSPLRTLIPENINFDHIRENIANNYLETFEIITNCYESQQTISFYEHHSAEFEDWHYPKHLSERAEINIQHILASSALPLFFPAEKINGLHYGDGSMGLISPLRGAIRFDVNKIMVLGTQPQPSLFKPGPQQQDIGFAQVLGNILSSIFLDNLDKDIEMVNRMNEIAQRLSLWKKRKAPWRPIETLYLRPQVSLSSIVNDEYQAMPGVLRFFLNLLGAKSHTGDLVSFLLFEGDYTRNLIKVGYEDTMAQHEAIENFFI